MFLQVIQWQQVISKCWCEPVSTNISMIYWLLFDFCETNSAQHSLPVSRTTVGGSVWAVDCRRRLAAQGPLTYNSCYCRQGERVWWQRAKVYRTALGTLHSFYDTSSKPISFTCPDTILSLHFLRFVFLVYRSSIVRFTPPRDAQKFAFAVRGWD